MNDKTMTNLAIEIAEAYWTSEHDGTMDVSQEELDKLAQLISAKLEPLRRTGEDLVDELALYLAGNRKDPPSDELQAHAQELARLEGSK